MSVPRSSLLVTGIVLAAIVAAPAGAQQGTTQAAAPPVRSEADAMRAVARLVAEPASLTMRTGETRPFTVVAVDAQGNVVASPFRSESSSCQPRAVWASVIPV